MIFTKSLGIKDNNKHKYKFYFQYTNEFYRQVNKLLMSVITVYQDRCIDTCQFNKP